MQERRALARRSRVPIRHSCGKLAMMTSPPEFEQALQQARQLQSAGRQQQAEQAFRRLATAHFNLALLYKKNNHYADAMASYEDAIRFGIDHVQEVYSNMGVLYSEMREADNAVRMYQRSLHIDPNYIPALFNLAGLFEETGERQQSTELYRRILSIDPGHWDSLARLAYATKATNADDTLIDSLKAAIEEAGNDPLDREGL
jgi:tetratricopeptide (TPR) repeat protein